MSLKKHIVNSLCSKANRFILIICFTLIHFALLAQGPGNALVVNGMRAYVEFGREHRGITNQVTAEAWIRTSSLNNQHFVVKYDRDSENGFQLHTLNGKAGFSGRDGSGLYRVSGYSDTFVADGKWHHLAGVCTGTEWLIYVDGVLEATFQTNFSQTNLRSNEPLLVGGYFYSTNTWYYTGAVDEVRVWKRALSVEEIRTNMCKSVPPASPDLVAYFKLDEASGSTVQDYSSYKLNGTFRNITPSSAWITSGAAIGDKSIYLYPNTWQGQKLEMVNTDGSRVWVDSVNTTSNNPRGIHLYYVDSRPNSTTGIQNPQTVSDYYGVFPALTTTTTPIPTYNLNYASTVSLCSTELFARQNNAVPVWQKLTAIIDDKTASATTDGTQKEFVFLSQKQIALPIAGPSSLCAGSSIDLSVTTDLNPVWSNGQQGKKITVTQAGKYWVTATYGSCTASDTIVVEELPLPEIDLGKNLSICEGSIAMLQAPDGFSSYKWSNGSQSPELIVTEAGTYWVDVVNANGCIARGTVEVLNANVTAPAIALNDNQHFKICYGENVVINATTPGAAYMWSNGSTAPAFTASGPGEHWVDVLLDGCTYRRHVVVEADECPFIPNIITPNGDGLNDTFTLKGLAPDNLQVQIFNRWGKLVYQSGKYENSWGAADVATGMYYYHIKSSQSAKEYKGWVQVVK